MSKPVSTFSFPTATLFGPGTIAELPARIKQMGSRRPLVVTDSGLVQTRAFQMLAQTLDNTQLGKTWEMFHDDWRGLARCVCIPTTAGTGSEVGRSSVITLAGAQQRSVIFLPRPLAKLVILDPELTVDLPPKLTAATGLDALTHCVESFTSPVFQPFCDGIALEGIHLIVEALPKAVANGK